jgi:hypothetical protein
MECNIDNHGAKIRRVYGIMSLLMGGMLGALAVWSGTWWLWIVVGLAAAGGIFCLFEAQKKWCALRAMGMKTPV